VTHALNLDQINFQKQLDPVLWFSDSPGQVSRNLNQIVNLDVIDSTLSNLGSEVRSAGGVVDFTRQRLKEAQEEAEKLKWVPEFEAELNRIQQFYTDAQKATQRAASLSELLGRVRVLLRGRKSITEAARGLKRVLAVGEQLQATREQGENLTKLVENIRKTKARMKLPVPDDLDKVLAVRGEADRVTEGRSTLEELVGQIDKVEQCRSSLGRHARRAISR
jgi:hypothetical protein